MWNKRDASQIFEVLCKNIPGLQVTASILQLYSFSYDV